MALFKILSINYCFMSRFVAFLQICCRPLIEHNRLEEWVRTRKQASKQAVVRSSWPEWDPNHIFILSEYGYPVRLGYLVQMFCSVNRTCPEWTSLQASHCVTRCPLNSLSPTGYPILVCSENIMETLTRRLCYAVEWDALPSRLTCVNLAFG